MGNAADWRFIGNGGRIYADGYCDQPYVVTASDGTWAAVFTTSPAREGAAVQYIACTRSTDHGRTWSEPVAIEPPSGVEASWGIPLITDFDRIYVFYTYNGDRVKTLNGKTVRSDTHGWYCYRYSDDLGRTWSPRQRLDMRLTACDRGNEWGGRVQMFWGIGKPVSRGQDVWFSFTKLGGYFLKDSEGWLYHSDNVLTERDAEKVRWELLPEGEHGIRSPQLESVQEEHNLAPMNRQGGLYCIYRTTLGRPACAYSFDGGRSWTQPELMEYATGRPLRNPRACPRVWKCGSGRYLLWYHNHGGTGFADRNPAWIAGGVERNGRILWSQPEILLYGRDRSYETGRFSYPDLIEQDGRYWVTTTQKTTATVHEVEAGLLEGLWGQFDAGTVAGAGLIGQWREPETGPLRLDAPLSLGDGGFAMDLWLRVEAFEDAAILAGEGADGRQVWLDLTAEGRLKVTITDGRVAGELLSDEGRLTAGTWQHVAVLADAGPGVLYMLIDGSICDGGSKRQFGFSWYDPAMQDIGPIEQLELAEGPTKVRTLRVYGRRMTTSAMVGNYRAERER